MFYEKSVVSKHTVKERCILLECIAGITIWSMLPVFMLLHLSVWIYQHIYFSIFDIPKISIRDYVTFDRFRLRRLNIVQKSGCVYCAYGNGIAAWLKAVANRTEVYSCAIKHRSGGPDLEYQKEFMPYEKFL
jgi:hypothetical protein